MTVWTRGARAQPWWPLALALLAGALLPFAFAPFECWPLAILCPAVLMRLWSGASARRAALLGFAFGAGTFGAGTWWLYISIRDFGGAPIWLAVALIVVLVLLMASYYALLGWLAVKILPDAGRVALVRGAAGTVAAVRVVARLVPVRLSLVFSGLLADRHLVVGLRAGARCVRRCRRCCCCRPERVAALGRCGADRAGSRWRCSQ